MKERHLICNAHIDPIWQWDWPEGVSAVLSTFQSAVNLAEKFEYIFCHNEVTVYKYVEEYAPELFEKIKELVKRGKWHIMGGWYLQPDCNMPTGESFVRQIREGQSYFLEKFGKKPTTAINFDPFGHSVGLVQIIKKCGQDSYIFMRPYASEMELPSEQFIWRGLDGSEIKAARSIGGYNTPLGTSAETIKKRAEEQDFPVGVVLWGVGNHGGGPSAKDLADIERELLPSAEIKYVHSTPEAFFAKIEPKDVVDTSLRISMPGCYTSTYRVKKLHAQLEAELYLAEKMATLAYATGALKEYPEKELKTATEDLLNAEFHDVLPGTSVQCGEEAGLRYLNHGILEAERVKIRSYFALAELQKVASDGEFPIVIFNPHPYRITDNVECEFMLADQNWSLDRLAKITVKDSDGNTVPYQVIKEESNLNLDWRKRIIFEASLEPLKMTRYSVFVDYEPKRDEETRESFVFDNGHKHVSINKNTGLMDSYKLDGVEYLTGGVGLAMFDDNADPWAMGAHQLIRLGEKERPFELMSEPDGPFKGMKSVEIVEDGDIYLGIEAFFRSENTRARILYKIYKNTDDVDIDVTLYLGDIDRIVKLRLPTSVKGKVLGQTAFGTEELFSDARENVAHRFTAVTDDNGDCVALLNKGVYGGHYENGTLYASLVRGVTYCAHPIEQRQLIPTDKFTKKIDQGENNYSFRLTVINRDLLQKKTREFVERPYALNIFPIAKDVSRHTEFEISLGDEAVTLEALKKSRERDGIVIRLLNNTEKERKTTLRVCNSSISLSFGKYEVKTVLYRNDSLTESYELII